MAMFNKTNETKVLRDPVHGYIHVKYQVIWDCINAKEFQRLHRIHQLGGDFQIYHTAEHSRFSHSLGVYEITRRMCEVFQRSEKMVHVLNHATEQHIKPEFFHIHLK